MTNPTGRKLTPFTPHTGQRPVFLDPAGRRWRRVRRAALAAGIATTVLALGIAVGLLIPPLVPELPLAERPASVRPAFAGSRTERERIAFKLRQEARQRSTCGVRLHRRPLRS